MPKLYYAPGARKGAGGKNMFGKQMDRLRDMTVLDWALIKATIVFSTLTILKYIPALMHWVQDTNALYFLIAAVVFGAGPVYKIYIKK